MVTRDVGPKLDYNYICGINEIKRHITITFIDCNKQGPIKHFFRIPIYDDKSKLDCLWLPIITLTDYNRINVQV
jgi:hypothetical protein